MLKMRVTTIRKAKTAIDRERVKGKERRRKSPIIEEYERYLAMLERGRAITFTLDEDDKFQTIKYRLNSAARSLGIKNLKIERAGRTVVFYREARSGVVRDGGGKGDGGGKAGGVVVDEGDASPGMEGELMFDEELEEPMLRGYKTCEARAEKFDGAGFEAFGRYYAITKVEQLPLGEISETWFKEHGHFSTKEFREIWKQRHGGLLDPDQRVWLHHFERGFEPPAEEDSVGLDTVAPDSLEEESDAYVGPERYDENAEI